MHESGRMEDRLASSRPTCSGGDDIWIEFAVVTEDGCTRFS